MCAFTIRIRVMMMKKKAKEKPRKCLSDGKFLRFGSSESEKKFNLFRQFML